MTTGSASSRPRSASRAPRTWPPSWVRWPRWAASTSPTRSRPCRVSGQPAPPATLPRELWTVLGGVVRGRRSPSSPRPPRMLLFFAPVATHGGGCHAIQSWGGFSGVSHRACSHSRSNSCPRGWPRGVHTSASKLGGRLFSPHPFLPIFLCWVLFQNHYGFFFFFLRERKQRIDRCHVKC